MALASLLFIAAAATAPLDAPTRTCPQIAARTAQLKVQIEKEDALATRRAGQARMAKGLLGGLASGALGAATAELAGRTGGLGALAAQQALSSASLSAAQALTGSPPSQREAPEKASPARIELEQLDAQAAAQGC